jgi:hypothetical protein
VDSLLEGEAPVDDSLATTLAQVFHTSINLWRNLEATWRAGAASPHLPADVRPGLTGRPHPSGHGHHANLSMSVLDGLVRVDFGVALQWMMLSPEQARSLSAGLAHFADRAEGLEFTSERDRARWQRGLQAYVTLRGREKQGAWSEEDRRLAYDGALALQSLDSVGERGNRLAGQMLEFLEQVKGADNAGDQGGVV